MASASEYSRVECGNPKGLSKETRSGRTAHNVSSSSLRKKSDLTLVSKLRIGLLRELLTNLQLVLLGTKLSILFPAIPLAIVAHCYHFGKPFVFALSLLGLTPLAERLSYLTEQITFYTSPTIGGLLNATCGNVTELVIAIFALYKGKIEVVKCSLLGSILSNLLLVLGTSLLCGGLANLRRDQKYDRKQADVNTTLLILGLLCQILPLLFRHSISTSSASITNDQVLLLSRVGSMTMLVSYIAYLFFQLKTHRHIFEEQQEDEYDDTVSNETPEIGFASAVFWLVGMTIVISVLSEYVVGTIEDVSQMWHLSVSFISVILLPIVGNATEHAGAIIFALKDKLDISLGVSLGSATQISMFVVPLCVVVAWIMGSHMNLHYNILEIGSLFISVLVRAFALQDGTSHYLKGLILLLCYLIISACFFILKTPPLHGIDVLHTSRGLLVEDIVVA